jgi:hypothetical protein
MTPLLRWGKGLLKLELLGSPRVAWPGSVSLSGNQALAAAQSARGRIALALRGAVTHEMREALRIWGATLLPHAPDPPDLSADFARTLGEELAGELEESPPLLVAPAAESAALLGTLRALRAKWPTVRGVALVAEDEELPDLPRESPPGVERLAVSRRRASDARARLARELGLLAGHASAAAADYAREHGGVALVTGPGEREFSIE